MNKIGIWGESAFPHLLIIYLYHRRTNFEGQSSDLLKMYLSLLIAVNGDDREVLFPNPYYSLEEVLLFIYGDQAVQIEEKFKGDSYTIDACIQLLAREGEKEFLAENWGPITKISQSKFTPESHYEWFRNRCDHGTYDTVLIEFPTQYTDLVKTAAEINRVRFPKLIDDFRKLIPLFLILMPHRLEAEIVKYLAEMYEPVANN